MANSREFKCEVLVMIQDIEIDETHRLQVMICSWNGAKPNFEIRPRHVKNGEWRYGQAHVKLRLDMLKMVVSEELLQEGLTAMIELEGAGEVEKDEA